MQYGHFCEDDNWVCKANSEKPVWYDNNNNINLKVKSSNKKGHKITVFYLFVRPTLQKNIFLWMGEKIRRFFQKSKIFYEGGN